MSDINLPEWVTNATGKTSPDELTPAELEAVEAAEEAANLTETLDGRFEQITDRLEWSRLELLGAEIDARIALAEARATAAEAKVQQIRKEARVWRIAFWVSVVVLFIIWVVIPTLS